MLLAGAVLGDHPDRSSIRIERGFRDLLDRGGELHGLLRGEVVDEGTGARTGPRLGVAHHERSSSHPHYLKLGSGAKGRCGYGSDHLFL